MDRKETGRHGESLVESEVMKSGWRVVERNWRAGRLEIDLVAERDRVLAFIEVKARTVPLAPGHSMAPSRAQRRRLTLAAALFLERHPRYRHHFCRFDVAFALIDPQGGDRLEYHPDAYRAA